MKPASERRKKRRQSRHSPSENPGVNPGADAVPMREQEHGGSLRTGGTNEGGPGRTKNVIREMAALAYEEGLPILAKVANGTYRRTVGKGKRAREEGPTLREMKDAMTELGNRGIGKMLEIDIPKTPVTFSFYVSPEVAAEEAAREAAKEARGGGDA